MEVNELELNTTQQMKNILEHIEKYLRSHNESTAVSISRTLQELSATLDLQVFNPQSILTSHFYSSLYDLIKTAEPCSQVPWACVDCLLNACRNSEARSVLIHTYQFIPALSRLFNDQLTIERKTRLLQLMQQLSCGIAVSWQMPHLPHMLTTLCKWVESANEQIVTLSLGVMVNMCYKNLPAIYTLNKHVDIKRFIRTCMPLKGSIVEVHVCKLLIILDHMSVSENTIIRIINPTFKWLIESFLARDPIQMRQIVEFFLDLMQRDRESQILNTYTNYETNVEGMLNIIDNNLHNDAGDAGHSPECMAILLQFIQSFMDKPNFKDIYPRLVTLALQWLHNDVVSVHAVNLINSIAEHGDGGLLEQVMQEFPSILLSLGTPSNKVGGLLLLLRSMLRVESIRDQVLQDMKPEVVLPVFQPLIGEAGAPKMRPLTALEGDNYNTYVYALALMNEALKYDINWIDALKTVSKHSEVNMVLSRALYCSPAEVKEMVLEMAARPGFSIKEISSSMCSMQSSVLYNLPQKQQRSEVELVPVVELGQLNQLDSILKRCANSSNIATSDVIELYEYKIRSVAQSERVAQQSIEAASERCSNLQQRLAHQSAELSRLNQMLFRTQQCHEEVAQLKKELDANCQALTRKLEESKAARNTLHEQFQDTIKQLHVCKESLAVTAKELNQACTANNELQEENDKLKQVVIKLEENGLRLERNGTQREAQIKELKLLVAKLEENEHRLEKNCKQRDDKIADMEMELRIVNKELISKRQIIDTIMNVANSSQK